MGLGNYPFATLTTIGDMANRLQKKFTLREITHTGIKVICLLKTIRSTQPFKVPKKPTGGLLNLGSIPVNDFVLAQHLIATKDPEMEKIIKDAGDVPVLLAYLAVIAIGPELPDEYLLESALPFAMETLAIEGKEAERSNKHLLPLAVKALRHGASQASRRTGKTKLNDSQKKQVVRQYEAALVTYGMVKSLAGKFDVSADTISRIVNAKPIQKETKQD